MTKSNDNAKITILAQSNYRNTNNLFGIKEKDRGGHMYIVGKTGTGKSTLIENMVIADIMAGNGLALIDPHGDLADSILGHVPEGRVKDVIYFNPADIEYPIAFNPLETIHPDYHHLVASGLLSVFKKIWADFWGPRLEHILRNSILTLLAYQGSTLLDIPRLLTNKAFRLKVLVKITDPQLRDFWFQEYDNYSAWMRSSAISPILNKMGQFLSSVPLRNIVGQRENTFKLRKVMDEGKILIVNLAKGKIGEDNCALLGAMIVTRIQLAAMSRASLPESERKHFYLYVDEVHNFLTESFADILSEARKYGLCLILAHQYIEQLEKEIRTAVFGNVGTIISFRVGAKDASYLSREFLSVFKESDIVNLPNHQVYMKLLIDGFTSKAFSAATLAPPEMGVSYQNEIIAASRAKYNKPRRQVEADLGSNK